MVYNDRTRRIAGAVFLGISILMLVVGQTALESRLRGVPMLLYWMACFVFTFLAMIVALLDASIIRRRIRNEERELFEDTLREIGRKSGNTAGDRRRDSDPGISN